MDQEDITPIPDDEEILPSLPEFHLLPEHGLIYIYEGEQSTFHPMLGEIHPGENDLTGYHPDAIAAAEQMVQEGTLKRGGI